MKMQKYPTQIKWGTNSLIVPIFVFNRLFNIINNFANLRE